MGTRSPNKLGQNKGFIQTDLFDLHTHPYKAARLCINFSQANLADSCRPRVTRQVITRVEQGVFPPPDGHTAFLATMLEYNRNALANTLNRISYLLRPESAREYLTPDKATKQQLIETLPKLHEIWINFKRERLAESLPASMTQGRYNWPSDWPSIKYDLTGTGSAAGIAVRLMLPIVKIQHFEKEGESSPEIRMVLETLGYEFIDDPREKR